MRKVHTLKEARGIFVAAIDRGAKLSLAILRERAGVDVEHAHDLWATLIMHRPDVLIILSALADSDADAYLREVFEQLALDEPELFELAPSVQEYAKLEARALQGAEWRSLSDDHHAYYLAGASAAYVGVRRRGAFEYRQRVAAREAAAAQGEAVS